MRYYSYRYSLTLGIKMWVISGRTSTTLAFRDLQGGMQGLHGDYWLEANSPGMKHELDCMLVIGQRDGP